MMFFRGDFGREGILGKEGRCLDVVVGLVFVGGW